MIENIVKEDNSLLVNCQLHTGKATVTFSFYSENDTADEITANLVCSRTLLVRSFFRLKFSEVVIFQFSMFFSDHADAVSTLWKLMRQFGKWYKTPNN